ncbi:MAG: DNA translocase FtsK 4TM domain-containing protein [Anaerolineae bacterium]|jgi:S-DNA-T family DNA segregation ATPase FtsK/SpoIIIE
MSRKRTKKAKKQSALGQKLQSLRSWRPWQNWQFKLGRGQRQIIGLVLVLLAVVTFLGLVGVSTGSVLGWWISAVSQLFGWMAYPLSLALGVAGLRLVWQDLYERLPLPPSTLVALETLVLVILIASHAPLVIRLGPDESTLVAQEGRGGGYIGWALAVLLMEGLGPIVGSVVLLALLMASLLLLLSVSWEDMKDWSWRQIRTVAAAYGRWRSTRQGTPVAPELEEEPWWEKEPEPAKKKAGKKRSKRSRTRKKAKPRPVDGTLPSLDLLDPSSPQSYGDTDVRRKVHIIEDTLESFGVPASVVEVNQGPAVTQFGLDPGYIERRVGGEVQHQRVRVARIARLANDLSLALAASPIRIEAPVPGRPVVGLEVPNESISVVALRGVMESDEFNFTDSQLALALGEDVSGLSVVVDLGLMPHLLIAGATGSGKSVCMNAVICCLLFNNAPEDLQMLMIDPKMVELVGYNGIPHLLAPVVVQAEQVVGALAWVTSQMDERYKEFNKLGVRNLDEYNRRVRRLKSKDSLPILVVLIDELADLMMVAPDEVERHICRVAQMGRATGIHLVIATQRPSVDVVTGLIKANFPARISFAVTSQTDSRVILDQGGAENLLGRGDMLFMSPQQATPVRLQGCFVSDREINRLTKFWRSQVQEEEQTELFPPWTGYEVEDQTDDLLRRAVELIEGRERVSASFLQRRLHIGFPRAARLIDQLEDQDFVGPDEGGGRGRQVLVGRPVDLDEIDERLPGVPPA